MNYDDVYYTSLVDGGTGSAEIFASVTGQNIILVSIDVGIWAQAASGVAPFPVAGAVDIRIYDLAGDGRVVNQMPVTIPPATLPYTPGWIQFAVTSQAPWRGAMEIQPGPNNELINITFKNVGTDLYPNGSQISVVFGWKLKKPLP